MKRNRIGKIAILSLLVALIVSLGLLIQQLGLPLRAYAVESTEQTEVVGSDLFVDMRSKALGLDKVELTEEEKEAIDTDNDVTEEGLLYEKRAKIFANWDFQDGIKTAENIDPDEVSKRVKKWEGNQPETENQNFEVISSSQIASIKDVRYNVTIGAEAAAITLKSDSEATNPKITEQSALTVFTYGQGSALSHWSNKRESKDNGYNKFVYQYDSLIETLRRQADADVYVAKTKAIDVTYGRDYCFDVRTNSSADLLLYKLEADDESYERVVNGLTTETSKRVNRIEDMTKHNIILFDSNNAYQYHNFIYNELNIILTQISYDYLLTIGQVPKINMTSHSTGGVWNMMWAINHPFNVKDMFPIASPFNGSTTGQLLDASWGKIKETIFGDSIGELHNMITSPSGIDNIDQIRYNYLHDQWEEAVEQNNNLQCYAFTGLFSADLVKDMLVPGLSESAWGKSYILQYVCRTALVAMATAIAALITAGVIVVTSLLFGPLGLVAVTVVLSSIAESLKKEIYETVDAFGEVGVYVLNNLMIDKSGDLCLMDDGLVDYNSALGYKPVLEVGEDENRREIWYSNFERFEKAYRPDNTDLTKKTVDNLVVPHNLESQDAFVISHISENIKMGVPEVNNYETSTLVDGTLSIDRINNLSDFKANQIIFPNKLNGVQVTEIGDNILKDNTEINFVGIGEKVIRIGDSAFSGMINLKKVKLEDQLAIIGEQAFQGDKELTEINIPYLVEEIESGAFQNCSELEKVQLLDRPQNGSTDVAQSSRLRFVGADAFDNTKYSKSEDIVILGKVLIKYNSSATSFKPDSNRVSYFAQKCFAGSNLEVLDVSEFEFKDNIVPDYFVYGAQNLRNVKLPDSIIVIGNHSFEETVNLEKLTLPVGVEAILSEAFKNSGIKTLTAFNAYPPVISKDSFSGINRLNVLVKAYAVSDYEINWAKVVEKDIFTFKTQQITLNFIDSLKGNHTADFEYFGYLQAPDWMTNEYYVHQGYYFLGWFTTPEHSEDIEDKQYYIGSLLEFELGEPCNLYARWDLVIYNVWYETYGGESNNKSTVTIKDDLVLNPAYKVGYDFVGWYYDENFAGDALPDVLIGVCSDIKLYAKYTPKYYIVNYDTEGISVDRTFDSFAYGERFQAPVPVKYNCAFAGWYDENGIRITGINGISIKKNYFTEEVTLYAQWTTKSFVIEFSDGTNSYVWGQDGLTGEASSVLLGQQVDVNNPAFRALFEREGYIVSGFVDQDGNYVDFTNGVPDLGENFSSFVLTPVMVAEKYKFVLYDHEGNLYKVIYATYDDMYDFSIARAGYEFAGWKDKSGQIVLEYMNGVLVVDFTPNTEADGEVELYVQWEAAKGNISFDSCGGTKVVLDDDYQSVYLKNLPSINIPSWQGHKFEGFYDENGVKYIDENGEGVTPWDKTESFVTLYAHWSLIELKVTYKYNDHVGTIKTDKFDVEHNIKLREIDVTKVGYTFKGWYNAETGGTLLKSTQGIYDNLIVYARWEENVCAIPVKMSYEISLDNRAINLKSISTVYSSVKITLTSEVKNIFIYGSTTVKLVIIAKADNLNLYLRDVEYTGFGEQSALKANNIKIFVINNATITGADGEKGTTGSNGLHSYDHGTPSNGSPHARDGGQGDTGKIGKNGQMAVEAKTVEISGTENAKLTLNGGKGGEGGTGGYGGNGAYGNDGETGGGKDNGVSGGHGGNGGIGGIGGNGAYAIKANKIIINDITLCLNGGNGGKGGAGGQGGNGGNGGKGANNPGFLFFTSNFAGRGGDGGDHGSGGKGGAGGQGSLCSYGEIVLNNNSKCYKNNGRNGNVGAIGVDGIAGKGGRGGSGPIGGKNGNDGK